jgi:hypothetical protein
MSAEEKIMEALASLREADRARRASPEVEAHLRRFVGSGFQPAAGLLPGVRIASTSPRRPEGRRQAESPAPPRTAWVAAAAALAMVLTPTLWRPAPPEPSPAPVAEARPSAPLETPAETKPALAKPASAPKRRQREFVTEFFPLTETAAPLETGALLRVRVPSATLRTVGLPFREDRWEEMIDADVLVGQEGTVRAIRFVGFEQQ